jgi:ABC-type multidrug transport system fused ATPase/permease subunit
MPKQSVPQKVWYLLGPELQRRSLVLFGLMLVGMALETLGIGLVIPALALMTQSDMPVRFPVLARWIERAGSPGQAELVMLGMATLVAIYTTKTFFLAYAAWRQASFVGALQASVSRKLFAGYLRQPYIFHLQRNSAQLINQTISQAASICGSTQQGLTLLTEALVILGISVMLLVTEPVGAIAVVGIFAVAGWLFSRYTRQHTARWGKALLFHEGFRVQRVQEGLGGVKEVKILGREDEFLAQYDVHNRGSARAVELQSILQALPRLWLEWLAVVGLAILVSVMIGQGKPVDALLPTLGLFAAAAFRMIPSANRILAAIQGMRFSLPVLDLIHSEIRSIDGQVAVTRLAAAPLRRALELRQVSYRYPQAERNALTDVSLLIPKGATIGFVGGSGAGKSTLVDILLGLLAPSRGTVCVDGDDIQPRLRAWQDQVGYVPQSIFLTDDTLRRNIAFGLPDQAIDDAAIWRSVRDAQLEQFVNGAPQGLDTMVGERGVRLSGGQRQRIGIARALYRDPAVLVLDEATSSLDTATEQGVMEAVRALRGTKTVIIVAHRLSTVESCDRIYWLEKGSVIDQGEAMDMVSKVRATVAGTGQERTGIA